ncbi:hypothetical protein MXB_951 [Myxobolus squamalis]|nr:hypothetical protein MXB_951 [Myxobolus squamalis]
MEEIPITFDIPSNFTLNEKNSHMWIREKPIHCGFMHYCDGMKLSNCYHQAKTLPKKEFITVQKSQLTIDAAPGH